MALFVVVAGNRFGLTGNSCYILVVKVAVKLKRVTLLALWLT